MAEYNKLGTILNGKMKKKELELHLKKSILLDKTYISLPPLYDPDLEYPRMFTG